MFAHNKLNNDSKNESIFNDFEKLYNSNVSEREKISRVIFELSNINVSNNVQKILNDLKIKKGSIVDSYSIISEKLKEELILIIEEIYQLKLKNLDLERQIDSITSELRDQSYVEKKHVDVCSSEEYKDFLSNYDVSLKISQEIIRKKYRLEAIIENQKLLDQAYSAKMLEIDFQIAKLSEVVNLFEVVKVRSVANQVSAEFNNYQEYEKLVIEKDDLFSEKKEEFKSISGGWTPANHHGKTAFSSINETVSKLQQRFF